MDIKKDGYEKFMREENFCTEKEYTVNVRVNQRQIIEPAFSPLNLGFYGATIGMGQLLMGYYVQGVVMVTVYQEVQNFICISDKFRVQLKSQQPEQQ